MKETRFDYHAAVGILVAVAIVAFALWIARTRSAKGSKQQSIDVTIHSGITNPVKFAKSRFTGGVGAALSTDRATGVLLIDQVMAGSPAEKAGLPEGDHIAQVDGVATSGRTLARTWKVSEGLPRAV